MILPNLISIYALEKIVLLTLKGRFEFGIEPGNQIFSEELDERTIQRLLLAHMKKQKRIGTTRTQITKSGKRHKGPKEMVLRDVLGKRRK